MPMLAPMAGAMTSMAKPAMDMMSQAPGMQMMKGLLGGGQEGGANGAQGAGGEKLDAMAIIKMLIEALQGKGADKAGDSADGGGDAAGDKPHSQGTNKLANDKGHKGQALDQAGAAGQGGGNMLSSLPPGTTITIGGGGQG
jgi:hypothetical protein